MKKAVIYLICLWCLGSCSLLSNEEVTVPAYIYIPGFIFITDTTGKADPTIYEGANTQKFVDMWLYESGNTLGNIGVPTLIPVQKTGLTELRIDPGIIKWGQDGERLPYPFVESYITVRDLKPNVIDTIQPVFKYFPQTRFKFIEDFDRPDSVFYVNDYYYSDPAGQSVVRFNDNRARQPGTYSAELKFPSSLSKYQLVTKQEWTLPGFNQPVYLELDYYTNLPLDIGYYYEEPNQQSSAAQSLIEIYPSSGGWNRIYIPLQGEIAPRQAGTNFKFYIGVFNNNHIEPEILLDNIKLVYLE